MKDDSIGIRMTSSLKKRLQEIAKKEDRKPGDLARLMLQRAVEEYERELGNPGDCLEIKHDKGKGD